MTQESVSRQLRAVVTEGRRDGGSFFGSILAGTLLGLGVDWWLETTPIFVVVGVLLGIYAAFARLWHEIQTQPDHPAVTLQRVDHPDGEGSGS